MFNYSTRSGHCTKLEPAGKMRHHEWRRLPVPVVRGLNSSLWRFAVVCQTQHPAHPDPGWCPEDKARRNRHGKCSQAAHQAATSCHLSPLLLPMRKPSPGSSCSSSQIVCRCPHNTVILFLMVHECKRFACHLTVPLTCS